VRFRAMGCLFYTVSLSIYLSLSHYLSLSLSLNSSLYVSLFYPSLCIFVSFSLRSILCSLSHFVSSLACSVLLIIALYQTAELFFYGFGAIIYANRWPERVWPGRFDFFFSSHQLMHICVIIAATIHYNLTIKMYEWRQVSVCHF
jgi:predicted membrane channel-forming protein YqfA (hemolysin III family)